MAQDENKAQNEPRKSRKKMWLLGSVIFVAGIIFYGVFGVVLEATNTTEFCTSCHTMTTNLTELKETAHYNNASGVIAGCADCHVPRDLGPKLWAKLMAAKDVFHEIIGTIDTPEKYEAHRWDMANRVWDKMRATDSRECKECHSLEHMFFEKQIRSARKQHSRTLEMGDKTCIDCHKGIAHKEPTDPEEESSDMESSDADEEDETPHKPVTDNPSTGKVDGATLAKEKCESCHGSDGNSKYEEVPNIAGFSAFYLKDTMKSYKTGARPSEKFQAEGHDETDMKTVTETLSDAELTALADFFAEKDFETREQEFDSSLARKGKLVYRKYCKKCHSDNGREPDDDAGILAGQSTSYLKKQLEYFKEGKREQVEKMEIAFGRLKEGDIEKLLHFFAQQQ
jgi:cytochrome c-type protein NapC